MNKVLLALLCALPLVASAETDLCPRDPAKSAPGVCGCGVSDKDKNRNGVTDCLAALDLQKQLMLVAGQLDGLKTGRSGPAGENALQKARRIARNAAALLTFWENVVAPIHFTGTNPVESAESFGSSLERLKAFTKKPAKLSTNKKKSARILVAELQALLAL